MWTLLLSGLVLITIASGFNISKFRNKKALSVFNIYSFPNDPCINFYNLNQTGTCYSSGECEGKGGSNVGPCANGFGVCCVFAYGCDATTTENGSYFQLFTTQSGKCGMQVCKANKDICQLRFDFNVFLITGPNADSNPTSFEMNGRPSVLGEFEFPVPLSLATQCQVDTFTISSPGGVSPPVICGQNTGQHVYADAYDDCTDVIFQLGANYTYTPNPPFLRQWIIKISQISCFDPNLAPSGCTQYYFGSVTGSVQSFNFGAKTPIMLANQSQQICVRREIGYCTICWTPQSDTDFVVSASGKVGFNTARGLGGCCNYGISGVDGRNSNVGYECVMIQGATVLQSVAPNTFCGQRFVSVDSTTISVTICSIQTPFILSFYSDNFSYAGKQVTGMTGFKLTYFQKAC